MAVPFDPFLAGTIGTGAEARRILGAVERFCSTLAEETLGDVERVLASGRLTPELALARWHEVIAYRRILHRLRQKVVAGEKAAVRLAAGHDAAHEEPSA